MPLTPQDVILKNHFEQIEQLQLMIIRQQSDIITATDEVNAKSTLLYRLIKDLQAFTTNRCIPELDKIIRTVSRRSIIIDEKVPDEPPPVPPDVGTRPPPSSGARP